MAAGFAFDCSSCDLSFETSGMHEFYRNAVGEVLHYGHPIPVSDEARAAGISGFLASAYCPGCKVTREVVTHEFGKSGAYFDSWMQAADTEPALRCPSCRSTMILFAASGVSSTCPSCGSLSLRGELVWQS